MLNFSFHPDPTMHQGRHLGTLGYKEKWDHQHLFCFQEDHVKHHLAKSRELVRQEDAEIKFCDHRRESLCSGWANSLLWHEHLGMGCSNVQQRRHVVSAAGIPAHPPQLLCIYLPVHPVPRAHKHVGPSLRKVCSSESTEWIMEAPAQLLCFLLLWLPGERNEDWFCMPVQTSSILFSPPGIFAEQT